MVEQQARSKTGGVGGAGRGGPLGGGHGHRIGTARPRGDPSAGKIARCPIARPDRLLPFLLRVLDGRDHGSIGSVLAHKRIAMSKGAVAGRGRPLRPKRAINVLTGGRTLGGASLSNLGVLFRSRTVVIVGGSTNLLSVTASSPGRPATCHRLDRCIGRSGGTGQVFIIRHLSQSASNIVLFTGSRRLGRGLRGG